jgi:mRNA-degrading endonuclease RelE of RelBE toxin-antitoxin system
MGYGIEFTPTFEKALKKLKKKDKALFEQLSKKMNEIADDPTRATSH